jgi:Ca2+-binding RTX toxin-like protein
VGRVDGYMSLRENVHSPFALFGADVRSAVTVSLGATTAQASPGESPPTCHRQEATIVGTKGDDTLTGTAVRHVIVLRGGDDFFDGGGGDDVIWRGPGKGFLSGSSGLGWSVASWAASFVHSE